jgi:hypothetical protein
MRGFLYVGALTLAACHGANGPTGGDGERIAVFSGWSIVVPRKFKHEDQGSSWRASDERRVVTVKLQDVSVAGGGKASLEDLAGQGDAWLKSLAPGDRILHDGSAARGQAIVRIRQEGWELEGYMASDGSVVVCVIDAEDPFKDWAISTWRSLEKKNGGSDAQHKPPKD